MTRQELIRDMKAFSGSSFMSRHQLSKYMGFADPHTVDKFIRGLPSISKRYFIPDIATVLYENQSWYGDKK